MGYYQSEEEFHSSIRGAGFGEYSDCDCPSEEYDEALKAMEGDFGLLEEVLW